MEKFSKILAILGFLAAVAGLIANDVIINFTFYFTIIEIFAVVCFLTYFVINLKLIKTFSKQRSTKYGATSLLGVIIFIAILVVINIISSYHVKRFDWTKGKIHSLSDQTLKVLENLEKDITVTAFFRKNSREKNDMEGVLNGYKDYTDKIKVDFVDPDLQPSVTKQYNAKLYTTVFESGEKDYRIEPKDPGKLEELITNAIVKVTRKETKNVYFTKDHEENSIDDKAKSGYSFVKEHLEGINYNVNSLSLLKTGNIPDDCDVLIIANPKKPFMESELKLLDEYVNRNGKLIFLVDIDTDKTILDFLAKYGFYCHENIIVDKSSQLFGGDFSMPIISKYSESHDITKEFQLSTLYSVARSISFTLPFEPWQKYIPLAEAGQFPNVWGETNLNDLKKIEYNKDEDMVGVLEIAGIFTYDSALKRGEKQVTPEEDENVCEIVTFGDSDFISNAYFSFFGNADFFTNTVNYLARELDLISVTPKKAASSIILLSDSQRKFVYYFSIFLLPVLVFAAGIIVWLKRRNL